MNDFKAASVIDLTKTIKFQKYKVAKVSILARIVNAIFGSPNWRRANGIISTNFDVIGRIRQIAHKVLGYKTLTPVFTIDPVEGCLSDKLPRIWLSEKVANTKCDDGRRVFVESYPNTFDFEGRRALELGDRYLGEGLNMRSKLSSRDRIDCFKAAEILYLHAIRKGNRCAVSRLKDIYDRDLCNGEYWLSNMERNAKHAKKRSHMNSCA